MNTVHLQEDVLLAHVAGTQHPVLHGLVTAHVASCRACRRAAGEIEDIVAAVWEAGPGLPVSDRARTRAIEASRIQTPVIQASARPSMVCGTSRL